VSSLLAVSGYQKSESHLNRNGGGGFLTDAALKTTMGASAISTLAGI